MTQTHYIIVGLLLVVPLFSCGSDSSNGERGGKAGEVCGGSSSVLCSAGLFCNFPVGSCGAESSTGVCEAIPEACIEIFMPVCGCDGKTYSNSCTAAASSVSVKSTGECVVEK